MTKCKRSLDGKVRYFDGAHTYYLGKKKLTSGTTWLKPFFDPFDSKAIAKKIAAGFRFRQRDRTDLTDLEKAKQTQRYWLNEWKEASAHGTRTHELMEQFVLDLDNLPNKLHEENDEHTPRDIIKFGHGSQWLADKLETLDNPELYAEYIVYNEDMGVAGQIDLKVVDEHGVTHLWDWKTNKEILKRSKYGKKCKDPISDLPDCNYVKYVLQLSLYAYMEELKGATIGDLIIVHLTEDGVVPYQIEYRKDLIEKLIMWEEF